MYYARWITCLWPGLPRLWWRGEMAGLAVALFFTALLNAALLGGVAWPSLLSFSAKFCLWGAVFLFWVLALRGGLKRLPDILRPAAEESAALDGLFQRAQCEYLKGHWLEAELGWRSVLERRPEDIDSRLMLATLLRRVSRCDEARKELRELVRLEGAAKWSLEIRRELQLLAEQTELAEHSDLQNRVAAAETEHAVHSDQTIENSAQEPKAA